MREDDPGRTGERPPAELFAVLRGTPEVTREVHETFRRLPDRGFASSLKALRALESAHPREPSVHVGLGALLRATGRHGDAADAYLKAAQLLPDVDAVLPHLANACIAARRLEEALAAASEYRRRRPDDPRGHLVEGHLLLQMNRLEEAEVALRSALNLEAGVEEAYASLAALYDRSRRFGESLVCLEELQRLRPRDPFVQVLLGRVNGAAGDLDACRTHLEEARLLDPENPLVEEQVASATKEFLERP